MQGKVEKAEKTLGNEEEVTENDQEKYCCFIYYSTRTTAKISFRENLQKMLDTIEKHIE